MQEDFNTRYRSSYHAHSTPRHPAPATHQQPQAIDEVFTPAPTRRAKRKHRGLKIIIVLIILAAVVSGGGFYYYKHRTPKPIHYFPSYVTKKDMDIAVYYPLNLPQGYKVNNDYKIIQHNVLYYSVSNKAGDKFYITIQPLAPKFDFTAFQKKFNQPDQYVTPIGAALVGPAGSSLIGSIQTNQNSWILLNSTSLGSKSDMETITRALKQVSL